MPPWEVIGRSSVPPSQKRLQRHGGHWFKAAFGPGRIRKLRVSSLAMEINDALRLFMMDYLSATMILEVYLFIHFFIIFLGRPHPISRISPAIPYERRACRGGTGTLPSAARTMGILFSGGAGLVLTYLLNMLIMKGR
jgi:hypothetical protein